MAALSPPGFNKHWASDEPPVALKITMRIDPKLADNVFMHQYSSHVADQLFDAAWNLVATRNLTNDSYKGVPNPGVQKSRDRATAGQVLVNQFGNRIRIQDHARCAARMCKGVVTDMGGSGKRLDIWADLRRQ